MSKQSAVEWLFLMLNNPNGKQDMANKLLEQAKEMERQNIIDAYNEGRGDDRGEDYYNQTLNNK